MLLFQIRMLIVDVIGGFVDAIGSGHFEAMFSARLMFATGLFLMRVGWLG